MIYMVEMDFRLAEREHDWHAWYLEHTTRLVRNVPGFTATQRFRAITPTPSPWLAMHEVAGPQVFASAEYAANGGPASTGEWKDLHLNWHRNLFDGLPETPDVSLDSHLVLLEGEGRLPAPYDASAARLISIGLDGTSKTRSLAVVPAGDLTARLFGFPHVRIFKPITPRIAG